MTPKERIAKQKAAAWRCAANILEDEALEMIDAPLSDDTRALYRHIINVIIPNLRRRADIIDR